jgi:hypothetical protein
LATADLASDDLSLSLTLTYEDARPPGGEVVPML